MSHSIEIGEREDLSAEEKDDLKSLYRCLSMSVDELEQELIDDTRKEYFAYEKQSNNQRLNYIFDRIWYMNTCEQIRDYSSEKFQEFISNKSKWNEQAKQLCNTISRLLKKREVNPSDVKEKTFTEEKFFIFTCFCFQYASVLIPSFIEFDPTSKESQQNDAWTRVEPLIKSKYDPHRSFLFLIRTL